MEQIARHNRNLITLALISGYLFITVLLWSWNSFPALVFLTAGLHTVPLLRNYVKGNRLDLFEPVNFCLLSSFILFVSKPVYYYLKGFRVELISYRFPMDTVQGLLSQQQLLVMLGLLGLYLGYYSRANDFLAGALPVLPGNWGRRKLQGTVMVLLGLAVMGYLLFFSRVGGMAFFSDNIHSRVVIGSAHTVFYRIALCFMLTALLLLLAYHMKKMGVMKTAAVVGVFLIYSSVFGVRTDVVFLILTILVFWNYTKNRISLKKIAAVSLVVLTIAFGFLFYRSHSYGKAELRENPVEIFFDRNMFSDKGFLLILERVPEEIPYYMGRSIGNAFVSVVPRSLWKEKPVQIGYQITQKYFNVQGGFSITFPGELYLNFGVVGVFLGMLLLGFFIGGLKKYRQLHHKNRGVNIVYAACCFWLFDLIYKDLWHFVSNFIWTVVIMMLIIFLLRKEPDLRVK